MLDGADEDELQGRSQQKEESPGIIMTIRGGSSCIPEEYQALIYEMGQQLDKEMKHHSEKGFTAREVCLRILQENMSANQWNSLERGSRYGQTQNILVVSTI